jgi:hypothetical protein
VSRVTALGSLCCLAFTFPFTPSLAGVVWWRLGEGPGGEGTVATVAMGEREEARPLDGSALFDPRVRPGHEGSERTGAGPAGESPGSEVLLP